MKVYESNSTGKFIIISVSEDNRKCVVQFLNTGTTKICYLVNAYAGKIKDQYCTTVYNNGYYGDFEKVHYWKEAKQLWQNMLKRCYCEKDSKGYFGKSFVCERWKCFANFLEDLPSLKNFDKWLLGQNNNFDKYNLDKDLIIKGNKIYSKELCQFITEYENKSEGAKNGKPYTKIKMGTN